MREIIVRITCGDYLVTLENGVYNLFYGVESRDTPIKIDDGITVEDISYLTYTEKYCYTLNCSAGYMIASITVNFEMECGAQKLSFVKVFGKAMENGDSEKLLNALFEKALEYMAYTLKAVENEHY